MASPPVGAPPSTLLYWSVTSELWRRITVSASRSIASLSPYGIATSRSTPMKTFVVVCDCRALSSLHSLRQQEHRHFVTIWHHLVSQSPPAGASPLCHHMASPPVGAPPSRLLYWYVTRQFCPLLGCRNRKDEVIINRLRIGHTRLTYSFRMENRPHPPLCDQCEGDHELTVKHILIECNFLKIIRRRHYDVTDLNQLFKTVSSKRILDFVKDIGLYNSL